MKFSIKVGSVEKIKSDCLVAVIWSKGILSDEAGLIDIAAKKALSKLLRSGDFTGKLGETHLIHDPVGAAAKRLLLVGGGDRRKMSAKNAAKLLTSSLKKAFTLNTSSVHFALASLELNDREPAWLAARLAQQAERASYSYDTTKSKKSKSTTIKAISLSASSRRKQLESGLKQGQAIGKAISRARQLGNLPGNICTPSYLAKKSKDLGDRNRSLTVKVLSEKQMARLGMGSLLSVSAGSAEEAKLIVIRHNGARADSKPHVLVGKGVTFDTGGISLKSGAAMDEMKFDMCGAASVIAVMSCCAELKLPINVVGIIGAVENMPGSKATKPGDIVTSMAGKTIEVLNTDAEGRLVLCDALTYAAR